MAGPPTPSKAAAKRATVKKDPDKAIVTITLKGVDYRFDPEVSNKIDQQLFMATGLTWGKIAPQIAGWEKGYEIPAPFIVAAMCWVSLTQQGKPANWEELRDAISYEDLTEEMLQGSGTTDIPPA